MTTGEKCAEAVREYLKFNGITQAKLTGKILAEIIDRVIKHDAEVSKKKRRLATEEEWLRELEAEPHLAGVNVRKELAAAQFWAKNNSRLCTRKFFVNWLGKAERSAVISPGGNGTAKKPDLYNEPAGWRTSESARAALHLSADSWKLVCERTWLDLASDIRADILRSL